MSEAYRTGVAQAEVERRVDAYLDAHWDEMVGDIERLVKVPSTEALDEAAPNAPFGPGPRRALDEALSLAANMGFEPHDADGYVGFADFPGTTDRQLGIIGHMDVVPAGPGWTLEPFAVTRKAGNLFGRGVLDDKGPCVCALHALKFWKNLQDEGLVPQFPYTVRFIFGANEETGMHDVEHYQKLYDDPAFLFTPDAYWPVCYGEKGGFDGTVRSKEIPEADRMIVSFEGGAATNAVPGHATATVRADASTLPAAPGIAIEPAGEELATIRATGKGAHASTPEGSVNAIGLIVDYLLEQGVGTPDERAFLEFDHKLLSAYDGSGIGIASSDEYFGALTVVGGTIAIEGDRFVQTLDSRFPTNVTADGIAEAVRALTDPIGAELEIGDVMVPFLTKPDTPGIQALLAAYVEATGKQDAQPFTIGGGTYARHFARGASFGPEDPSAELPEWVGPIHGPDEGVSEASLKEAFRVYALAIGKLMEAEL